MNRRSLLRSIPAAIVAAMLYVGKTKAAAINPPSPLVGMPLTTSDDYLSSGAPIRLMPVSRSGVDINLYRDCTEILRTSEESSARLKAAFDETAMSQDEYYRLVKLMIPKPTVVITEHGPGWRYDDAGGGAG